MKFVHFNFSFYLGKDLLSAQMCTKKYNIVRGLSMLKSLVIIMSCTRYTVPVYRKMNFG